MSPADAPKTILEGLAWRERPTSHMGALEGCVKFLGLDISPAWLFGGTGHAFVMNVEGNFCPSGPHDWDWLDVVPALARHVGLDIEALKAEPWDKSKDFSREQERVWNSVRKALDSGFPCYGWHYEFMVIKGYEGDNYLLSGPVGTPRVDPEGKGPFDDRRKFGASTHPGFVAIFIVRPGSGRDDAAAVREAFRFALTFPDCSLDKSKPVIAGRNLAVYDNCIRGLERPDPETGFRERHFIAYHAAIWSECRQYAAAFMTGAIKRLGKEKDKDFAAAAGCYGKVAESLAGVARLFPWADGETEMMVRNIEDENRRARAVELFKRAKEEEYSGQQKLADVIKGL